MYGPPSLSMAPLCSHLVGGKAEVHPVAHAPPETGQTVVVIAFVPIRGHRLGRFAIFLIERFGRNSPDGRTQRYCYPVPLCDVTQNRGQFGGLIGARAETQGNEKIIIIHLRHTGEPGEGRCSSVSIEAPAGVGNKVEIFGRIGVVGRLMAGSMSN